MVVGVTGIGCFGDLSVLIQGPGVIRSRIQGALIIDVFFTVEMLHKEHNSMSKTRFVHHFIGHSMILPAQVELVDVLAEEGKLSGRVGRRGGKGVSCLWDVEKLIAGEWVDDLNVEG